MTCSNVQYFKRLPLPLALQATQSVIAFAIVLKSNKTLRSVDISRPLLFSHQVRYTDQISPEFLSQRTGRVTRT